MSDQPHNWLENFLTGFNPGLAALALTGVTGTGKLIYDFVRILLDGYRNKSKAQLDAEIQENKSQLDGHGMAIKVLQEGLDRALSQNKECEEKHNQLVQKYDDIILRFAFKGEKLERKSQEIDVLTDKLTNVENSEILKNLKEIEP